MSKHDRGDEGQGELTTSARALERELQRFEELVTAARRIPLDRQKSVERAAKATTEAAGAQERVDAAIGALSRVIAALHARHQESAVALQARGEEIQARGAQLAALLNRWGLLGAEGQVINEAVRVAAAEQREATTPERVRVLVAEIDGIEARMTRLADEARTLAQDAAAESFADLAEQGDALRQQVTAARNKMGLIKKGLAARLQDMPKPN